MEIPMRTVRTLVLTSSLLLGTTVVAPTAALAVDGIAICNTAGSWWGNFVENFWLNLQGGPGSNYICDGSTVHKLRVR
jgi:hypothetical protein